MSDTTTPTELEIPDAALARHYRPHRVLLTDADVVDRIRDVAAPVVAAELRRLAEEDAARLRGLEDLADRHGYRTAAVMEEESRVRRSRDRLRARADELDGTTP